MNDLDTATLFWLLGMAVSEFRVTYDTDLSQWQIRIGDGPDMDMYAGSTMGEAALWACLDRQRVAA